VGKYGAGASMSLHFHAKPSAQAPSITSSWPQTGPSKDRQLATKSEVGSEARAGNPNSMLVIAHLQSALPFVPIIKQSIK
jgi:hypothetical protein